MRKLLTLLAPLALIGSLALVARAQDPSEINLVKDPCGVTIPADMSCVPAVLTEPWDNQTLTATGDFSLTFRGVAPRDSQVFLYFLREDGSLVNSSPHKVNADGRGKFSLTQNFLSYGQGKFRGVSYALTDSREQGEDESFYQLTGMPFPRFEILGTATPPTGSCPVIGAYERFELPEGFGDGSGFLLKAKTGAARTFYWAREAAGSGNTTTETVRTYIIDTTISELQKVICTAAEKENAEKDLSALRLLTEKTMVSEYLSQPGVRRSFISSTEVATRIEEHFKNAKGCTEEDLKPRDLSWAPLVNGKGVLGWTLINHNSTYNDVCEYDSKKYMVSWVSGASPLLFLTSDASVDARVQVTAAGGEISYSDPMKPSDGWQVSVDGAAPTLYYEFLAPHPSLPVTGWTVAGDEVEAFVTELLGSWGYDAVEVRQFVARDIHARMPEAPFVEVRLFDQKTVDALLPLTITPAPDQVERLLFHLTPTATPASLVAPEAVRHAPTGGFTAREFGAIVGPTR